MFISGLGLSFKTDNQGLLENILSTSTSKCWFKRDQLYKNHSGLENGWLGVGEGGWGPCREELNSWNYGQQPVFE